MDIQLEPIHPGDTPLASRKRRRNHRLIIDEETQIPLATFKAQQNSFANTARSTVRLFWITHYSSLKIAYNLLMKTVNFGYSERF